MSYGNNFIEDHHVINAIVPVSDFAQGDVTTDEVCMARHNHLTFLVMTGVNGSEHDIVFTVNSCSSIGAGNTTRIPFQYSYTLGDSLVSRNTWSDYATATAAAGYNTDVTASNSAANRSFCIDVDADDLSSTSGVHHEYCSLTMTECGGDVILGNVIAILSEPRFSTDGGDHLNENA